MIKCSQNKVYYRCRQILDDDAFVNICLPMPTALLVDKSVISHVSLSMESMGDIISDKSMHISQSVEYNDSQNNSRTREHGHITQSAHSWQGKVPHFAEFLFYILTWKLVNQQMGYMNSLLQQNTHGRAWRTSYFRNRVENATETDI